MKTPYFVLTLKLGLLWALLAALPCVQTLMAQYSNPHIMITPPQKLSQGEEDNEIVILKDKIAFVDRTGKDTCAAFHYKKHNPYYKPQLPKFCIGAISSDRGGFERYDLGKLTQKEVVALYGLQNMPEPVPSDFKFGHVRLWNSAVAKSNIVIVQFVAQFNGWCAPKQEHNCGGELLMAHKNTFIALNNKGEVIWQWYDYYNHADLELTENGAYLGISYGTIAEDYAGPFWPVGVQIVETATLTTIFKQDLGQVMPFGVYGNIFVVSLGGGKDTRVLTKFDTDKRIVYTLPVKDSEWATRFTKRNYKPLDRGFVWGGKTYLWDRDFKQTPFNQPLKLQQP